ncbi:MAG: 3-deoxy-manno-octulosonate cytidylyltransferase, partial [Bacteroidetes bacterium]|nr:3-deoxy-manno-octulosonate cytidylyltransferase [Bacteroidota bacterium]
AARVIVATDDERIYAEVERFGGEAVMTPSACASGTERMAWIAREIAADIYVNVQGDEPLLPPSTIDAAVATLIEHTDADIATACCPLRETQGNSNPHIVKLVTDRRGFALYFSRSPIPHLRDAAGSGNEIPPAGVYRKHIGIYIFRREALLRFASLAPTPLEQAEKLEQLRALEHGMRIVVAEVDSDSQAVDTPEDIDAVVKTLERMQE